MIFNFVTSKVSLPTVGVPRKPDDWRLKQFFFFSSSILVSSSWSITLFLSAVDFYICGGGRDKDSSPYYKEEDKYKDKYNYKETVKIRYLGGGGGDKDGLGEVVFLSIGRGCGGVNIVNDRNENIFCVADMTI